MSIIIVGDIHGDWSSLNTLINRKKPSLILSVGDFGWWPKWLDIKDIKVKNTEIYFCPGNHEDWDELFLRKAVPSEVAKNIFYMKRGATLELPDGRTILFMGGALSIDRNSRTIGVDWFPQEIIPYSEIYRLEEAKIPKVDIVISHTCPLEFNPLLNKKKPYLGWESKFRDSSQEILSVILEMYKPALWYFGHFHVNVKGQHNNTRWFCLNYPRSSGAWWRYIDE